jgi:hypothetical protein
VSRSLRQPQAPRTADDLENTIEQNALGPRRAAVDGQAGIRQTDHCGTAVPASHASEPFPAAAELQREGVVLDEASVASSPMLPYVRMVVSLIEGVEFTCREVAHLLQRTLRQHRIGAGQEVDYLLGILHRHPP